MIIRTLLIWLLLALVAWAQGPLDATPEEEQAMQAMAMQKLVRLRELSKDLMAKNPERPASYYFMGYSLHHSEGDLPRSKFYLEKCIRLFEERYGRSFGDNSPWGWWDKAMLELMQVSAEMDQYADQIKLLDRYAEVLRQRYGRDLPYLQALYAWPLMKLGKESEARAKLAMVESFQDEPTRTTYLNTLGAVEMETGHPQRSYAAFTELLDTVRRRGWPMNATYLRNAGEAAATIARFDEAERYYLEATEYFDPVSFSNPWWDLSSLYLSQARFPEAVAALKKAHQWTYDSQPFLAQQSWAAGQQLAAEILLQLGMTEHALHIASGIVDRPDRKGGDSVQRDQWEAANLLIYREALMARQAACREQMSWSRGLEWWKLLWEQRRLGGLAYLAGQRAAASLIEHDRLHSSLRWAFAPGTVIVPNYVRPELVTLYGPGVTLAALDEIEQKKFEGYEIELPYLESLRAEALARSGRRREALEKINLCLQKLPPTEALLRTRLIARAADVHEQLGNRQEAYKAYQQVLERAPGMMRTLGIPVPVEIEGADSDALARAASMVLVSPRFRRESGAFRIQFSGSPDELKAMLLGLDGSVLANASVKVPKKREDGPRELAAEIHAKFFAAHIDMTQLDPNSLDGIVTGAVQSKRLQELFFPGSTQDQK